MKKKYFFSSFLIINLLLFNFSSFIFADTIEPVPNDQIRAIIQNDFNSKYIASLNSVKSEYGLDDKDNFENAQLSSGTAYYKISDNANSSELVFAGYIYSIQLNNTDVATIYSNNDSGSWEIFNITKNINYEQPFLATKSSLSEGEHIKLVSDVRYGIDVLYINGVTEDRIIDLNSNTANLSSFSAKTTISKSVFDEKIQTIKEERAASPAKNGLLQMGSGQVDFTKSEDTSTNLPVILLFLGIILMIPAVFLLRKKTNH